LAGSREVFLSRYPAHYLQMALDRFESSSLDCFSFPSVHFSSGERPPILETWQAIRFRGNHGSIRGSWPIAISGSPRGHSVRTVTRCRSTQGRTIYLILPSNRASQEPNCLPPREDRTSSLPETLKLLADVTRWRRNTLLSSKSST
jgi:hypothetical protein